MCKSKCFMVNSCTSVYWNIKRRVLINYQRLHTGIGVSFIVSALRRKRAEVFVKSINVTKECLMFKVYNVTKSY